MDLLTQLNRAMSYIEAHICDDLTTREVSAVTSYSPYHFGRLFYYIADMPLSEYIRKRKLSLAGVELQSSDIKVLDLALKYGYDSADSFARAFAKQHGMSPTATRNDGVFLKIFLPLTFQIKIKGVQGMNWRIEERDAFEVFGIERIFSNNETNKVPAFWTECLQNGSYEKLFDDAGGVRLPKGKHRGVCLINAVCGYCEPGEDVFPYMLCALNKEGCKTDGYKIAQIPKATWAIFRSEESKSVGNHIPELFKQANAEWLPSSEYDRAPGPDMEIYGVAESGLYFEEVWIPVTKK